MGGGSRESSTRVDTGCHSQHPLYQWPGDTFLAEHKRCETTPGRQVLYAFSTYLFVHEVIDLSQELRLLSKYTDRLDVKLVVDLAMEIFITNIYIQTTNVLLNGNIDERA